MGNRIKGEVDFDAMGETWTLVYDFNSLVEMEEAFDVDASQLQTVLQGRMKNVRTVFLIGLRRHFPSMTDQKAGDIISAIGPAEAARLIGEAFTAAFPDAEKATKPGNARTPKAA